MQLRCLAETSVVKSRPEIDDDEGGLGVSKDAVDEFHSSDISANADRHRLQVRSGRSYNFALFKQSLGDQSENDEKALEEPETQNDEFCAKLASEKSDLNEYTEIF